VLLLPVMPFKLTMFRYDGIIANFARLFLNQQDRHWQGRNEAKWRPGQEASLAPQCSNLRSFGSKFIVLKTVLVSYDIVGTFRRSPQLFGAPILIRRTGNCSPHAPLVTPLGTEPRSESCNQMCQNVWQLWFARKFF